MIQRLRISLTLRLNSHTAHPLTLEIIKTLIETKISFHMPQLQVRKKELKKELEITKSTKNLTAELVSPGTSEPLPVQTTTELKVDDFPVPPAVKRTLIRTAGG